MESFITRYRNLVVLLALLMAQLVGLAVQVRRTTGGASTLGDTDPSGVRLVRLWANALISPPERLIHASKIGMAATWSNYIDLVHVRQQNKDLENTVDRLRLDVEVEVKEGDGVLTGLLKGDDVGLFIGRHGQTIDAVQHLAQRIVFPDGPSPVRVVIDADGYRERRAESLRADAGEAAEE